MLCNCHCNGKCKLLGGLEQKIMDVLWNSSAPLKPSQVLSQLPQHYAYTTIMTVLKRMSDKQLLNRSKSGKAFTYSPSLDKETFAAQCLDDLFTRLISSYGQLAADRFKTVSRRHQITLS